MTNPLQTNFDEQLAAFEAETQRQVEQAFAQLAGMRDEVVADIERRRELAEAISDNTADLLARSTVLRTVDVSPGCEHPVSVMLGHHGRTVELLGPHDRFRQQPTFDRPHRLVVLALPLDDDGKLKPVADGE